MKQTKPIKDLEAMAVDLLPGNLLAGDEPFNDEQYIECLLDNNLSGEEMADTEQYAEDAPGAKISVAWGPIPKPPRKLGAIYTSICNKSPGVDIIFLQELKPANPEKILSKWFPDFKIYAKARDCSKYYYVYDTVILVQNTFPQCELQREASTPFLTLVTAPLLGLLLRIATKDSKIEFDHAEVYLCLTVLSSSATTSNRSTQLDAQRLKDPKFMKYLASMYHDAIPLPEMALTDNLCNTLLQISKRVHEYCQELDSEQDQTVIEKVKQLHKQYIELAGQQMSLGERRI
ncbi:hypothetical protein BX667DRAFT_535694 [Coemansia mojavensis]|nr:hypothetical protein BX667DRAFT_535694 [Coemansia mojavensis]